MPITAVLDRTAGIWVVTTGARLTLEDFCLLAFYTDWEGVNRRLWDVRNVRETPETTDELREAAALVTRLRDLFQGGRVAIVVSTDLYFGLARMFQVFAENSGIDYQIFREIDEARDWLVKGA